SWSNAASLPWLERMELLSGCLPPDIHLTAQIHDYGTVDVGSSVAWGLIVANVGCQNLVINSITSNHNDFVVIPRSFPQTISPNDSIDVAITFAPSTIGTITGQLTVNSNDPDEGTLSVSLSGYGVAPVGESWWVTTTFTPSSIGLIEVTLTVISNDPDEPTVDINLSGTGVAAIASVPNVCATPGETTVVSIDVDNQTLKDTPVAQLLLELIFDDSLLVVANVEPTIRTSNMSIFDWDVPTPGQLTIQI
ncbi:MAG: choice-of-anchor D domain-containing protein, partial [bacterium]